MHQETTTSGSADELPLTALVPDHRGLPGDRPARQRLDLPWPAGLRVDGTAGSDAALATAVAVLAARYTAADAVTLALTTGPLRVDLAPGLRFDSACEQVQPALAACRGVAGFQGPPCERTEVGLRFVDDGLAPDDAPCPVCFNLLRRGPGPRLQVEFDGGLFEPTTIRRLGGHLGNLLAAAAQDPRQPVSALPLMDAAEQAALWAMGGGERRCYPVDRTIAELFEAQAARTPEAIAIEMGGEALSYAQLDAQADRLAALLLRETPAACRVVPVLHVRRPAFLVAVLAVLKCAKAFLPIEPDYPPERIAFMVRQVGAGSAVTEAALLDRLGPVLVRAGVRSIATTDGAPAARVPGAVVFDRGAWPAKDAAMAWPARSPKDPAYVIFTSGSTGQPKGVVNRHDGTLNHLFFEVEALNLTPATRFLQAAQLSTDLCVWQFLAPVLIGATCIVAPQQDVIDPRRLLDLLQRQRITIVELVPLLMNMLAEHAAGLDAAARRLPDLQWMMVSGEPLTADLANRWLAMFPAIPVVNAYGPTEVSDDSTQHIVFSPLPPGCTSVPVGRPLPNLRVNILDPAGRLVPIGVPGELHVSGIGLADGYWGDPQRTQAAFVPDPFAGEPGALMYRTGDRGRWRADGNIELFGRLDDQVKFHGVRIELREIEAVLRRHPAVANAVVVVREDLPGRQRLVAYVVPGNPPPEPAALRSHLAATLPSAMVPTTYVLLDALPTTGNGVKVDRKALPPPEEAEAEAEAEGAGPGDRPRTPLEEALAAACCQVLGLQRVGVHDNFFELGGDSMATIELALLARRRGIDLPVTALFEQPTIAGLAALARPCAAAHAGGPVPAPAAQPTTGPDALLATLDTRHGEVVSAHPLAPTQKSLYLARLLEHTASGVYIEQVVGTLHDPAFDAGAFERAWTTVAEHHPVLRTVFLRRGLKQPVQAVRPRAALHFHHVPATAPEFMAALEAEEAVRHFEPDAQPLLRVIVGRVGEHAHRFIWTYPHILLDGWSEGIVLGQVLQAYEALKRGAAPCLPAATPWRDFVEWSARPDPQATHEARDFWTGVLRGVAQEAPATQPWPAARAAAGPKRFTRTDLELAPDWARRLEGAARAHRWTTNTVLQGAWAMLLAWQARRDDVLFGVSVSGRQIPLSGVETIVGVLANTVPLRTRVPGGQRADEWLDALQRQQFAGRRHEHLPFEQIRQCSGLPPGADASLFATYFVFANYPPALGAAAPAQAQVCISGLDLRTRPHYPLTLYLRPGPRFLVRAIHDEGLLDRTAAAQLLQRYGAIVQALVDAPQRTLDELRQLSGAHPAPARAGNPALPVPMPCA